MPNSSRLTGTTSRFGALNGADTLRHIDHKHDQGESLLVVPRITRYCLIRNIVWILREVDVETTQLVKGVLDLAVLAVVAEEDGYGYDIVRRLRAAGLDEVGDASVYGTLRRLYNAGALTSYVVPSEEGPHRKYYGINKQGNETRILQAKMWRSFASTMEDLLTTAEGKG
jgi:PadR family transcriptional regulator PadR